MTQKIENMIIIGSWPAGHTAAIYAGRALLEPLMFEGFLAWGVAAWGQLTTTTDVENFPGFPDGIMGPELMMNMRQQSLNSWTTIVTKTVTKVDFSAKPYKVWAQGEDEPRLAHTVIITTWATAKRLWLEGEETYWQNWVSACAVCDGGLPIFRGKHLVVIGWGDSACEEANYLTKYASKVTMLVRKDVMKASKVMQERAKNNEKIEIMWNTEGVEITGIDGYMTGLTVKNNQTGEETSLEAGGLFYAIGHKPATEFLDGQLELDDAGYIMTYGRMCDEVVAWRMILSPEKAAKMKDWKHRFNTATSVSGVFAAWDVQDKKYRQAITSAGTGCMASLEAEHYLEELKSA